MSASCKVSVLCVPRRTANTDYQRAVSVTGVFWDGPGGCASGWVSGVACWQASREAEHQVCGKARFPQSPTKTNRVWLREAPLWVSAVGQREPEYGPHVFWGWTGTCSGGSAMPLFAERKGRDWKNLHQSCVDIRPRAEVGQTATCHCVT